MGNSTVRTRSSSKIREAIENFRDNTSRLINRLIDYHSDAATADLKKSYEQQIETLKETMYKDMKIFEDNYETKFLNISCIGNCAIQDLREKLGIFIIK
jgi:hypothetical protein